MQRLTLTAAIILPLAQSGAQALRKGDILGSHSITQSVEVRATDRDRLPSVRRRVCQGTLDATKLDTRAFAVANRDSVYFDGLASRGEARSILGTVSCTDSSFDRNGATGRPHADTATVRALVWSLDKEPTTAIEWVDRYGFFQVLLRRPTSTFAFAAAATCPGAPRRMNSVNLVTTRRSFEGGDTVCTTTFVVRGESDSTDLLTAIGAASTFETAVIAADSATEFYVRFLEGRRQRTEPLTTFADSNLAKARELSHRSAGYFRFAPVPRDSSGIVSRAEILDFDLLLSNSALGMTVVTRFMVEEGRAIQARIGRARAALRS